MRKFVPSGLRARLLLLVLMAVLPALLALAYNANVSRRLALDRAHADARQIAGLVAETEAQYREQARQFLVRLAQLPSIRRGAAGGCREAFLDLQTQYRQQYPRYSNLGIIAPSGEIYCSVVPASGATDVSAQAYFQRALDSFALTLGDYALDPATNKSTLSLYYPVADFEGVQAEVVVFATVDLSGLAQLAPRAGLPPGTAFAVVDAAGRILVESPFDSGGAVQGLPEAARLAATLRAARTGVGTFDLVDAAGLQRLFAYARLGDDTTPAPAYAIIGLPAQVILAQANREQASSLLALAAALVLALAGAWFGGDYIVLRQVQALVAATRRLSTGELGARTGLPESGGELDQLGHAFDHMAATLEQREGERQLADAALREREAQYRAMFEASFDGLIVTDPDTGAIVQANAAACAMHGYDPAVFVSLHPIDFIHPDHRAKFDEYQRTLRGGGRYETRSVHLRPDGTPFHVSVHGSEVNFGGRRHFLSVLRDITEQVQSQQLLERRVEERTHELQTLLQFQRSMASTLALEPLLGLILEQLQAVVECTSATLMTIEGDQMTMRAYRGPRAQSDFVGYRYAVKGSQVEKIATRRAPLLVPDLWAETEQLSAIPAQERARLERVYGHVRSWMGVPLIVKEELIGVLALHHGEVDHFDMRQAELATAFASQAAVALQNARLYEQAQQLATLQERQRLARDLHDSVSQALYSIALGARTARTQLDRDPAKVAEPLDYVLALTQAAMAEMRALIFELRPESLEKDGLVAVLTHQADSLRVRHRVGVSTQLGDEPPGSPEVKQALYRIAQEALHNVVKHARASHVELTLACREGVLWLEVQDDGAGFETGGEFPGHLGLHSMRERATQLGGSLLIESQAGQGTRVLAQVPLKM